MDGDLRAAFSAVINDPAGVDLGRGAATIARVGHPELTPEAVLADLDRLADTVAPAVPRTDAAGARAASLLSRLAELGFRGNHEEYYDPRNSFLNDVLERRVGIPISLSVLAIEVGRRLDIPLGGVGFPGHFLVRAPTDAEPLFLDPFHGGIELDETTLVTRLRQLAQQSERELPGFSTVPPEFLDEVAPAAILGRMLRNLVRIYLEGAHDREALATVDLLLLVYPNAQNELRTRGLLYERLDCPAAAAQDFRRYLELAPDAADAASIELRAARLADGAPTLH